MGITLFLVLKWLTIIFFGVIVMMVPVNIEHEIAGQKPVPPKIVVLAGMVTGIFSVFVIWVFLTHI